MKTYKGYVLGYLAKPNTNVYFVATERRIDVKGESIDIVCSKRDFDLGHPIEYKFTKRGEEYIAYA